MTINEIAKMAGVSSAAVSRYLNNGYISDEKREQIRKVIEETGYQPSLQAQMLRTKKTKLIHVIVSNLEIENGHDMLGGISNSLNQEGYDILLTILNRNCNSVSLASAISGAKARGADGILLMTDYLNEGMTDVLKCSELQVLICGTFADAFSSVSYDNMTASQNITVHLLSQGKCKTAYIGINPDKAECGAQRFEGYKKALTSKGIPMDTKLIKICDNTIQAGYDAASELLTRCEGIDAFICGTDLLAAGVSKYLSQNQTSQKIAVSGFGGSELHNIFSPSFTTVDTCGSILGSKAAAQLTANLQSEPETPVHIKLQPELIID